MTTAAAAKYAAIEHTFPPRARYLGAIIEPTPCYLPRTLNDPPSWADVATVIVDSPKLRRIVARWARDCGFSCTGPGRYDRSRAYHHRRATPWYSLGMPNNPRHERHVHSGETRTRVVTTLYINTQEWHRNVGRDVRR